MPTENELREYSRTIQAVTGRPPTLEQMARHFSTSVAEIRRAMWPGFVVDHPGRHS